MPGRSDPVDETPIRIVTGERVLASWTCTSERTADLAAGWLLSTGLVDSPSDVQDVERLPTAPTLTVRITLTPTAAAALDARLRHRRTGCGIRHFLDCEPERLSPLRATVRPADPPAAPPDADTMRDLFEAAYAAAERYRSGGGLHVAALVEGGAIVDACEEVGRHNAVDKLLGAAWRRRVDPGRCGLVLSARVSGAMVRSACRAGVAWIASRSVPTTLAVEMASAGGVTVVARAAGAGPRVFSPGDGSGSGGKPASRGAPQPTPYGAPEPAPDPAADTVGGAAIDPAPDGAP